MSNTNTTTKTISPSKAKKLAWNFFEQNGFKNHVGMVLHHKDITLKSKDPARYNQWLVEDLMPMSKVEHRRLHMTLENPKGTKFTDSHIANIIDGLAASTHRKGFDYLLVASKDGQTVCFTSESELAKYIGCTIQLISQVLSPKSNNRRAKGWTIVAIITQTPYLAA